MSSEVLFDQASGLRRLLGGAKGLRAVGVFGGDPELNALATANLASAMAQRGGQVCIFDESSAPRLMGQFGLTPEFGLRDILAGACPLEKALCDGPSGIRLLACEQAAAAIAAGPSHAWSNLTGRLSETDIDWLFLAAPHDDRPSLAYAAPLRILVVPGSKQRLTEAYALLKSVHRRQPEGRWWFLLMNLAEPERGAPMTQAITETSRRFLEVQPGFLGGIPRDDKLEQSRRAMRPVLDFAPGSPAAAAIRGAAETLAQAAPPLTGKGIPDFWSRMGLIGRDLAPRAGIKALDRAHGRHYG